MASTHWNIAVSTDTDQALRMFLASRGRGDKKADLSRFIEEAVRAHILELTAEQTKSDNAVHDENDIMAAINEALTKSRHS